MNLRVKVNQEKHCSGGYLSLKEMRKGLYLSYVSRGDDTREAVILSCIKEAKEAIHDFIRQNPDYELEDFIIEKM